MTMQEMKHFDLIDLLERRVQETPSATGFTFLRFLPSGRDEQNVTYLEIYDRARSIAVSLAKRGLKPGDRVIILSDQTADVIFGICGAILAGAVFAIIPTLDNESKKQRFLSVLESSGSKLILCTEETVKTLEGVLPSEGTAEPVSLNRCYECADGWERPNLSAANLAYLQYTSGSTNFPKGVMITHRNITCMLEAMGANLDRLGVKTGVFWAPVFHNMGLTSLFYTLYSGVRAVILTPSAFVENPLNWLQAISDYRADMTFAPNSAYDFCTKTIDENDLARLDLSSLKFALSGSETIRSTTLDAFARKFERCGFKRSAFFSGYGLAEATCVVTMSTENPELKTVHPDDLQQKRFLESIKPSADNMHFVSVGRLIDGFKAVIVDPETGTLQKEHEIGEIWLQSPTIASGYWNQEDETIRTFHGTIENQDGFFLKTGDIGTFSEDNLYIVGRHKEMIIINGHNLYPQDIEASLKESIPSLRPFAMASFSVVADGKESAVVCVEQAESEAGSLYALADSIRETFARLFEFTPYDIVFVRERTLPRTDNGKVQVLRTKEQYGSSCLDVLFQIKGAQENAGHTKKLVLPASSTEWKLLELFRKLLPADTEISTDDNFFALGGDSLAISRLGAMLKEEFQVDIPLKYLLDKPTIREIAACVELEKTRRGSVGYCIDKRFLYEECRLDESIVPDSLAEKAAGRPEHVFLTGSTGFVGAHLIRALMEQTTATVYCHVRAGSEEEGFKRIVSNAQYFQCWKEEYGARIVPVLGELTLPRLGLTEEAFERLSQTIDSIYHNGALLNFIYPYRFLKNINVAGTEECLRLACRNKAKTFHHISTFSVYDNPSHFQTIAYEDDPLESGEGYFLGYTESKWVGEKLVRLAENRGLNVCIYRPGEITGAKDSGIWKMSDMVSRFLVAGIQLNAMPDIPVHVHMTPVDYIANAIVHLSLRQDSIGKAFNLVNKQVKTVPELAGFIRSFGYPVEVIPYEEWKQRLYASGQENALKLLEPLFMEEKSEEESIMRRYADLEANFSIANTARGLEGTSISCAPVDEELLHRYLTYFVEAGFISAPEDARGAGIKAAHRK